MASDYIKRDSDRFSDAESHSALDTRRVTKNLTAINEERLLAYRQIWDEDNPLVIATVREREKSWWIDISPEATQLKVRVRYKVVDGTFKGHWRLGLPDGRVSLFDDYTELTSTSQDTKTFTIETDRVRERGGTGAFLQLHGHSLPDTAATVTNFTIDSNSIVHGRFITRTQIRTTTDPTATYSTLDCVGIAVKSAAGTVLEEFPGDLQSTRCEISGFHVWPPLDTSESLNGPSTIDTVLVGRLLIYAIEVYEVHGTPYTTGISSFRGGAPEALAYLPLSEGQSLRATPHRELYVPGQYLHAERTPVWEWGSFHVEDSDENEDLLGWKGVTIKEQDSTWRTLAECTLPADISIKHRGTTLSGPHRIGPCHMIAVRSTATRGSRHEEKEAHT